MDSDDDWDLEGAIGVEAEFEREKHAPKAGRVVGEVEEGQSVQSAGQRSTVSLSPCSSSSCGMSLSDMMVLTAGEPMRLVCYVWGTAVSSVLVCDMEKGWCRKTHLGTRGGPCFGYRNPVLNLSAAPRPPTVGGRLGGHVLRTNFWP